jgi:hypothetical protein
VPTAKNQPFTSAFVGSLAAQVLHDLIQIKLLRLVRGLLVSSLGLVRSIDLGQEPKSPPVQALLSRTTILDPECL